MTLTADIDQFNESNESHEIWYIVIALEISTYSLNYASIISYILHLR